MPESKAAPCYSPFRTLTVNGAETLRIRGDKRATVRTVAEFVPVTPAELASGKARVEFLREGNGRVCNVRPNGSVKTWKRDKSRVEVSAKFGMYDHLRLVNSPDGAFMRVWGNPLCYLVRLADGCEGFREEPC